MSPHFLTDRYKRTTNPARANTCSDHTWPSACKSLLQGLEQALTPWESQGYWTRLVPSLWDPNILILLGFQLLNTYEITPPNTGARIYATLTTQLLEFFLFSKSEIDWRRHWRVAGWHHTSVLNSCLQIIDWACRKPIHPEIYQFLFKYFVIGPMFWENHPREI